jgi:IMP dehydrogenase
MNEDLFNAFEALTFDDVLVVPGYTEVLPDQTDVRVQLTPAIRLNVPLFSAAMDTVTESPLAIALAREGGIGVVHKNMSPDAQAIEVDKVKRSESGMIVDRPDDQSGPIELREGNDLLKPFLAVLQIDRIDDRFPLAIAERHLDHRFVHRIDHERRPNHSDGLGQKIPQASHLFNPDFLLLFSCSNPPARTTGP